MTQFHAKRLDVYRRGFNQETHAHELDSSHKGVETQETKYWFIPAYHPKLAVNEPDYSEGIGPLERRCPRGDE
jgi:hypothetical protein